MSIVTLAMQPAAGQENAASSSRPRWYGPRARNRKIIRALSSPTCSRARSGFTNRFTDIGANQLRVLLTAAAYVLMQELRLRARGTDCARVQVWTLRERLLKLGARVLVSVRRMVVQLPVSFPFLPAFRRIALALGASPG